MSIYSITDIQQIDLMAFAFISQSFINFLSSLSVACKDHKHALEVSQHAEDMGLILGACAGGLVVLILLLGAIMVIVKKG